MDTIPQTQRPLDEQALFWWRKPEEEENDEKIKAEREAREQKEQEVTNWEGPVSDHPLLQRWRTIDPIILDSPSHCFYVGEPITKNEVMTMYKATTSIEEALIAFEGLVERRHGNFPPPGWHKYMIASGFLDDCNRVWKHYLERHVTPYYTCIYTAWKDQVYTPRPGNSIRPYTDLCVSKRTPSITVTDADDMEEEVNEATCERPTKLKK